jgi:DNA-binding transcriptional regulator YiaG
MNWGSTEIRSLRLRLGWSAAELGRRLGCSAETVMNWEGGKLKPGKEAHNQLSFLVTFVEQNAIRVAHEPMAELMLNDGHLAQVTNQMIIDFQKI